MSVTNLRFTDDIDGLAGSATVIRQLVSRLERAPKDYEMEISVENANNNNGMTTEVQIAGNTANGPYQNVLTSSQLSKEGSLNGMTMSRGLLDSHILSCKEQ